MFNIIHKKYCLYYIKIAIDVFNFLYGRFHTKMYQLSFQQTYTCSMVHYWYFLFDMPIIERYSLTYCYRLNINTMKVETHGDIDILESLQKLLIPITLLI